MEIEYNGSTVKNIIYNGTPVRCVTYNGTPVWERPDNLSYTVKIWPIWKLRLSRDEDEYFCVDYCFEVGCCGDSDTFCTELMSKNNCKVPYSVSFTVCTSTYVCIKNNTCGTSCSFGTGLCGDTVCFEGHCFFFDDYGKVHCLKYQTYQFICAQRCEGSPLFKSCCRFFDSGLYNDCLKPATFNWINLTTDVCDREICCRISTGGTVFRRACIYQNYSLAVDHASVVCETERCNTVYVGCGSKTLYFDWIYNVDCYCRSSFCICKAGNFGICGDELEYTFNLPNKT